MFKLLPESVVVLLPAFSLVLIGYAVEKHYVSRITCFTNSLALIIHYLTIGDVGLLLRIHANLGLLLGVIGFSAYLQEKSLPEDYYILSHIGYSSLVVGSIILYPQAHWLLSHLLADPSLPLNLFVALVLLSNLVLLDAADELFYTGARPADVNEFINKYKIRVYDRDGYLTMVPLQRWFED